MGSQYAPETNVMRELALYTSISDMAQSNRNTVQTPKSPFMRLPFFSLFIIMVSCFAFLIGSSLVRRTARHDLPCF